MLVALVIGYFVPSVIALVRSHSSALAVFALNLLLGWTLLGWVAALIWALAGSEKAADSRVATKACRSCFGEIDARASRCRHCSAAV